MKEFRYSRADDTRSALDLFAQARHARYLGGGTNLVDLMRETIEQPDTLIDVSGLSGEIEESAAGGLVIGAGVKNTALAAHPAIRRRYPLLAQAVVAGASGQIRNMATVGGNILQRTRCPYFYDRAARCNKRERGAGCDAREGYNRSHAILGASADCVAVHPSDMCVALAALDALVHLEGPRGQRRLPFADLHRLPGSTPDVETELEDGELITAVELPDLPFAARSAYRKIHDRASYAFALVSVAAAIDLGEDGTVRETRIALGGVAHKPWRATAAEAALRGAAATKENFRVAAEAELQAAFGLEHNAFKIELARRAIASTLQGLVGTRTP